MIILIFVITFLYLFLISTFIYGFEKVIEFQPKDSLTKIKFSVIIPFRNEAENLPELLNSISKLKYPVTNFEVIFINDASEDASLEIIEHYLAGSEIDFKVLQNKRRTKSPKKDAISAAIDKVQYDWILTTDADCLLPKLWLECYNSFIYKTNASMISGPVLYYKLNSFLDKFQAFDFLSLMGATIGGFGLKTPFLSNGANLAYKKDFFKSLNGFEGNADIASGDDVFLLQKAIEKHKDSALFLKAKEAFVFTKPQPDFRSLKSQRVRWASKTTHYKNSFGKFTGLLVLLMNTTLIASLVFVGIGKLDWIYLLLIFSLKISIDFILLFKTASFFNQKELFSSYLLSAIIYPFFSVYIAVTSIFSSYKWKDRAYRK
ncbi:glycosyltransferase [Xanthomarina sp. F1114]|uniref:glycosyltransferase family 2 protein n=1 Tax=Xanthomarina sp. F1114 TaxID=2996019 RepID=UPI00225E1AC1|nr:glycosyltransferase [Xanthomarina sp. F1114]MCX7546964.1 glycosyltransferase [Xanthomarina sp. F1114]